LGTKLVKEKIKVDVDYKNDRERKEAMLEEKLREEKRLGKLDTEKVVIKEKKKIKEKTE